jgi:hypothetical protein
MSLYISALTRRMKVVTRRPRVVIPLTAVLGAGLAVGLVASSGGAATSNLAAPPKLNGHIPTQSSPPPQANTTGPTVSANAVLSKAAAVPGVTSSAIKLTPYANIESDLSAMGLGDNHNSDPNWTPVAAGTDVYVVVLTGSVTPPMSHGSYNWEVELFTQSGSLFWTAASNTGSSPAFFSSLPNSASTGG